MAVSESLSVEQWVVGGR